MIYITGDTHALMDVRKLDLFFNREVTLRSVTKDDKLIILGDVALFWDGSWNDYHVKKYLQSLPCSVLWIDGNHENFNIIDKLPNVSMFGGLVNDTDGIIHLKRGEVYTIENKRFFTFGGAASVDRAYRVENRTWWAHEMPTTEDYQNGLTNLAKHDFHVNYILTHTVPTFIAHRFTDKIDSYDLPIMDYFAEISNKTTYDKWYFGHWHRDISLENSEFVGMYNLVERLHVDKEHEPSIEELDERSNTDDGFDIGDE